MVCQVSSNLTLEELALNIVWITNLTEENLDRLLA